jgi:general secretion pathway protein D
MSRIVFSLGLVLCLALGTAWAQEPSEATPEGPSGGVGAARGRLSAGRPAPWQPLERPAPTQPTVRRPDRPTVRRPSREPPGQRLPTPPVRRPAGEAGPPYETLVCHLENTPAVDVANTLNELLGGLLAVGQLRSEVLVVPEPVTNSLLISGAPRDLEEATRLVRELDRRPASVRVEVLIVEVQQNGKPAARSPERSPGEDALGPAWEGWDFGQPPEGRNAVARLLGEPGGARPGESNRAVRQRLAALGDSGQLTIFSRPQITALDNQPAHIRVGRKMPIPRATATTREGARTTSVAYEQVGVIVGITPRISRGGRVTMEINVEKSGLGPAAPGGYPSVAAGDSDSANVAARSAGDRGSPTDGMPQTETITLQTTVNLADGESTVIGGLAVESQPRRSKLVIVVTPHIIPPTD